jgi:hypothetical protein
LGGLRERKSMSQRRRGYMPRSKRTISFFWVSIRLLKVPYLSSPISKLRKDGTAHNKKVLLYLRRNNIKKFLLRPV